MMAGKPLVIDLNGHLGANIDPSQGMVGEGVELKVLWFGRGEKVIYLSAEMPMYAKPIGMAFEGFTSNSMTDYRIAIRYELDGNIEQTPFEPFSELLDLVYPPLAL